MNDTEKQLEAWIKSAKTDLDTATLLINEARLTEGLFFCLLAIEKGLKAHVFRLTKKSAPKSGDLMDLLRQAHIQVSEQDKELLGILMDCQLELRYPTYTNDVPTVNQAFDYLNRTRELLLWLERTL
ncbi:MAG TPA: HEPN domain-containing protein [Bacteroides sp.]|nr:HEPN domain-containing protein [Bacteroides sp.]